MKAFVANPCALTNRRRFTPPCLREPKRHPLCRTTPRASIMNSAEDLDQSDSFDSRFPERTQMLDDSDFIVDVAADDPDIDEEGLHVVDVLGDADIASRKRKRVRGSIGRLVNEIDIPPISALTSDADRQPPIQDDETAKYIRTAVKAADQRKAEDIIAMRVSKFTYITSFIAIATGNNTPQLRAIANLVEEDLGKIHGLSPRRIDGVPTSGWILLDYGDFLVNIFSPEQRRNYNLEGLWKRAENMDISDCIAEQLEEPEIVSSDSSLDDWLSE